MRRSVNVRVTRRSGLWRALSSEGFSITNKGHCEDPRLLGVVWDRPKGIVEVVEGRSGTSNENGRLSVERVRKGIEDSPATPVVIVGKEDGVVLCCENEGDILTM